MAYLYQIEGPSNKAYIGVAKRDPKRRWADHKRAASKGSQLALHCAIRKYGEENFSQKLLAEGSWEYVLDLERRAIKSFETKAPLGYNLTDGGDGVYGYAHTEESRTKNGSAVSAAWLRPDFRSRVVAGCKARWADPEYKAMMREKGRGRTLTAEHRAAIGRSNAGKTRSAAFCEKMKLASSFNRPEMKAVAGKCNVGLVRSAETRLKCSVNAAARRPEVKAKMKATIAAKPDVTCPHCGKIGRGVIMKKWHLDACRNRVVQ